jgi:hypothetical protein
MPATPYVFNGIDGSTGEYVTPELTEEEVAELAAVRPDSDAHQRDLADRRSRDEEATFAPVAWADPKDLATTGWGVLFPHDFDPKVRDALAPLLKHRRDQAAKETEYFYQEYAFNDIERVKERPCTFQPGDDKRKWLARNLASPGQAADPEKVPYYLMLVAPPSSVPYEFQYQLDVEYGVGRVWFETPDGKPDVDAFARYAESVVAAEKDPPLLPRRAAFFGVQTEDDPSTQLSAPHLAQPLAEKLARGPGKNWTFTTDIGATAKKARLGELLGGRDTPALLFTASHGMGFPTGDRRQLPHQGAPLCGDWPGPIGWGKKEVPDDFYFPADAVGDAARLLGLIAVHFACFGAGTPDVNDFAHVKNKALRSFATPRPIVARLPQRLLSHPKGGALAVIGHVDRAWSCSFYGGSKLGEQLATFQSLMTQLLKGFPVGYAMEYVNQYHAALGTELAALLQKMSNGWKPDDLDRNLSQVWTANNDARNFVVLGDPAVKLVAGDAPPGGKRREIRAAH